MYFHTAKYFSFLYSAKQEVQQKVRLLERVLGATPKQILEIGAGDGSLSIELSRKQHHVVSLEESSVFFAIMLTKLEAEKSIRPFFTPLPVSLENFKSNDLFDLVIATKVISSIPAHKWPNFLNSVHERLDKGAVFIFDFSLKSDLRPDQPLQEIQKKVFGQNTLHHLAKSHVSETGDFQEITFEYVIRRYNETIVKEEESHKVYLVNPDDIEHLLQKAGFSKVSIFGDWQMNTLVKDSPAALVIAYA